MNILVVYLVGLGVSFVILSISGFLARKAGITRGWTVEQDAFLVVFASIVWFIAIPVGILFGIAERVVGSGDTKEEG